jgi:hypothetical protein
VSVTARALAVGALWAVCVAGCGNRDAVRVKLQARTVPLEPTTLLEIDAQVAGPMEGLRYRWFAVAGECQPQESDVPKTIFRFAEGVRLDRVSVELWRANRRVAQDGLKVRFDEERARREQPHPPEARVEITLVPPAEQGGPDTRGQIAGKVRGRISPDSLVAVYVRAFGAWYIQPTAQALHPIKPDNTWATWTHTGTRYAALLVRPDFEPVARLDMLPRTNNYVLALDIVDGLSKQSLTNAPPGAVPPSH